MGMPFTCSSVKLVGMCGMAAPATVAAHTRNAATCCMQVIHIVVSYVGQSFPNWENFVEKLI
jgi:hypothetical protein